MKIEKIKTINISNHTIIQEQRENDVIFCNNDIPGIRENDIKNDSTYKSPDRQQYVFSTMGNHLYVLYPNGFASEIREKKALLYQSGLAKFLKGSHVNGRGVYIVESMLFHRSYLSNYEFVFGLTERFKSIDFNYNANLLSQQLLAEVNLLSRHGKYQNINVRFRLVTFIPETAIIEGQRVYHPDSGLVIGYGLISPGVVHPCNSEFLKNNRNAESDIKNFIEIDIVDNTTNNEYWTTIGNKPIRLFPERDYRREDACYINFNINEKMINSKSASLQDAADVLGIYNSKEEAEYNGNRENMLKEMEYKIRYEGIQNDNIKLHQDIAKLKNDNDKLAIEKQRLTLDYKRLLFDFEKLSFDRDKMDVDKLKSEIEYKLIKEKYRVDMYKLAAELKHMHQKFDLFMYNAIFDLIKKKMDFDNAGKINESKFNYEEFKSARDFIDDAQSTIKTTLSMGKMITGLIK